MKLYLFAVLLSTAATLISGKIALPLLKKLKVGQPILSYVKEHSYKEGTPTMGGIFFIVSALVVFFSLGGGKSKLSLITAAVTIAFGAVGFIDDFIKIKYKNNKGLTPTQKILFQFAIAIIVSVAAYLSGVTSVYIPFTLTFKEIGFFSIILNVFVFIATVNSVNLTDGLDGLCASVTLTYFIAICVIISLQLTHNADFYVDTQEYKNLILFSACLIGALSGYLVFNVSKASVFMGDCGSLALGGAVSAVSIFTANTLYVPVIGIVYVISALSVIIQVIYYKRTKKRVFLMAPLHHHFQHKGYGEAKISYCYTLVTALISTVIILCVCR